MANPTLLDRKLSGAPWSSHTLPFFGKAANTPNAVPVASASNAAAAVPTMCQTRNVTAAVPCCFKMSALDGRIVS